MTKNAVLAMIAEEEANLEEAEEYLEGKRGAVEDAMRVLLPIHQRHLEILRALAEALP